METSNPSPQPIGALLLQRELINTRDIDKALAFQQQFKGRFGAILVRIGAISEDALLPVLAEQLQLHLPGSSELPSQPETILNAIRLSGLSPAWFQDQHVLVWEETDGIIHCASRNPYQLVKAGELTGKHPL